MLYNTLQLLNNALIKQIVCLICRSLAEWHQFSRKKIDERKKINSFRDQTMNKKVCYDDFQAPLSFWKKYNFALTPQELSKKSWNWLWVVNNFLANNSYFSSTSFINLETLTPSFIVDGKLFVNARTFFFALSVKTLFLNSSGEGIAFCNTIIFFFFII